MNCWVIWLSGLSSIHRRVFLPQPSSKRCWPNSLDSFSFFAPGELDAALRPSFGWLLEFGWPAISISVQARLHSQSQKSSYYDNADTDEKSSYSKIEYTSQIDVLMGQLKTKDID
jgi:hypothetical protein